MSFDLAVWRENGPVTAATALQIYEQLCEGLPDVVEPDQRVVAFHRELTDRFPDIGDLDDEALDSSPWSGEHDRSPGHVLMTINWPRAVEIAKFVKELAAEHELVCFDPQHMEVRQPPAFSTIPGLRLTSRDGSLVVDPDLPALREGLQRLSSQNWFAILEARPEWYVQVGFGPQAGAPEDQYGLEYRAGSPQEHYRCVVSDLDDVVSAFDGFGPTETAWREQFRWERVVF